MFSVLLHIFHTFCSIFVSSHLSLCNRVLDLTVHNGRLDVSKYPVICNVMNVGG